MKGNNLVILRGHLGAAPEVRSLPSGKRVVELRVATNHVWRDDAGQKQERTDWHRISVFGTAADFCTNYLTKGDHVQVMGSIRNKVVDKPDGSKRVYTSIHAWEVTGLGSRHGGGYRPPGGLAPTPPHSAPNLSSEAVPF